MALLSIIRYERCLALLVGHCISLLINKAMFVGAGRREDFPACLLQLFVACSQIVWHLVDIVGVSHIRYFINKLVIRCFASLLVRSCVLRFYTLSDIISELYWIITDAALCIINSQTTSSLTPLRDTSSLLVSVLAYFALHLIFSSDFTAGIPIFNTLGINPHWIIILFLKLRFRREARWRLRRLSHKCNFGSSICIAAWSLTILSRQYWWLIMNIGFRSLFGKSWWLREICRFKLLNLFV